MSTREVTSYDVLPKGMAAKIMQAGWPATEGTIDESVGCGIIDSSCRCVWTTDGKRIEVSMSQGTFIVSQSKDTDPLYMQRKAEAHHD